MTRHDWAMVVLFVGSPLLAAIYLVILRIERKLNDAWRREDRQLAHAAGNAAERSEQSIVPALSENVFPAQKR